MAVRERIRINGKPISEEDFAKYFFYVWDKLEQNAEVFYKSLFMKKFTYLYLEEISIDDSSSNVFQDAHISGFPRVSRIEGR